ncbi:MAG TPA: hypothetical protein G4N98_01860 [Thermoflexia bacterium]|nr:hypothetical protein [Thermoflexia bacterium]
MVGSRRFIAVLALAGRHLVASVIPSQRSGSDAPARNLPTGDICGRGWSLKPPANLRNLWIGWCRENFAATLTWQRYTGARALSRW